MTGALQIGGVFQGFSLFLPAFLFCLVWGAIVFAGYFLLSLIVCIGSIAAMAGAVLLEGLLMFAIFLIAERKMAFWPASMESMRVVKTQFWPLVGYALVAGVLGSVGSVACGIGMIVTWPFAWLMLAVAYRAFFPMDGASAAPTTTTPPAPVPPAV